MLDKSIPYQNIIMCADRDHLICMEEPVLPEGFSFRLFCPGDEKQWARLEWAVGEFPTEKEALDYFSKKYLPYTKLLQQRCWFVWDKQKDQAAATATAWYEQEKGKERLASLHWVSTDPEYHSPNAVRLGKNVSDTVPAFFTFKLIADVCRCV